MTVTAGSLRRRQNQEAKAAAKAKREKLILAGGTVLLIAVLAFEVPKIMHAGSSSSSTSATTTATSTPSTAAATPVAPAATTITPEQVKEDLKAIAALPSKDPFQAQLNNNGTATQGLQSPATPPHVRASDFVSKDPFKAQISVGGTATAAPPLATPTGPAVTPTRPRGTTGTTFIVILRSLDTKASGLAEVKKARKHGLKSASLLYSSKYTTLRHGYWVVYLSTYSSVSAANSGLQLAHAHGYGSAYRRPVKK